MEILYILKPCSDESLKLELAMLLELATRKLLDWLLDWPEIRIGYLN